MAGLPMPVANPDAADPCEATTWCLVDPRAVANFVESAVSGQKLLYCTAPQLVQGETAALVRRLSDEGLLIPTQRRRGDGMVDYLATRTGRAMPRRDGPAPLEAETEAILRALKRAVNLTMPCPSDAELARLAGLDTRDQAQWRVRKLVRAGLIQTEQVTEDGVTSRIVTIVGADGVTRSTLAPPKMRAQLRAIRASMKEEGR